LPAEATHAPLARILREGGVVGVLRAYDADAAVQASLAAARAGLRIIELTFTTPGVERAIHDLRAQLPPGVTLGAGTVLNAEQAGAAVRAGAAFLVSPHLGEDIMDVAEQAGVPYLPGVLTPTEVTRALHVGASTVKLFPAGSSGGAAYLRDLFGPFPNLQVMVTGGITPAEVPTYRRAGALAVGLGSNLFPRQALAQRDWNAVEASTRAALTQAGVPA